ncbi:MAG: amidohydrolase family protein [Methanobrevibacter sp.]|jgi:cytosine/adenosine deaminase-related metal-dependent hydrolase|nr:amidohydrolase family protein [Methanobrevibacter sp.]
MITIANGIVLYGEELVAKNTNILIDDGKIIEISDSVKEGEIIDATGCIVCPSFLNAHTHIGDSIIADAAYGKSIEEIVKPPNGIKHLALEEASDDELKIAMKKSMGFMLQTGTSHFIDYREGGLDGVKLLKSIIAEDKIPINPIILGRDNSFFDEDPNIHQVKIAIRKLLKHCDGIAPSGFGEITDEVAEIIAIECRNKEKIASIHVAEYEKLQKDSIAISGKSEVERAINSGFNQLVHVVSPIANDLDLIAKADANIVLCPRSNAGFGNGISPLPEILGKGINPLIGTDNIMINSPNIFKELEFTLKIMRVYYKDYIAPKEILKMATSNIRYASSTINKLINKSMIKEGEEAQLFIAKNSSKDPYLSLINRTETKDITCLINRNNIIHF